MESESIYFRFYMKFVVGILSCVCFTFGAVAKPPNIVFFFTDDQTINTLGCYGNKVVQTPHIDNLAAKGVRFDNACVSQSICWVSRATILSGLTGRSMGSATEPDRVRNEFVDYLYPTLLKRSGYRTGFFGKFHARMPKGYQMDAVFDKHETINRNPFYKKMKDGSLRYETDLIVDRGIEFLKSQPKDQPFALNMWFNACHAEDSDRRPGIGHFPWPRSADSLYESIKFDQPRLSGREIFDGQPEFLKTTINRQRYFWRWDSDQKYQQNMRGYYRMVSGIDSAIGRLTAALDRAGLSENTIIVYSADNGYYMGNRGFAGKWSHYEESLQVPLIIYDPRSTETSGVVSNRPALNLDLPSTFLDWAGLEIPEHYQGVSLKPIVSGTPIKNWRTETFHEHFAVRQRIPAFEGLRNDQYKYARYIDHDFEFLHDLANDPDELVNCVTDSAYQDVLEAMRTRTNEIVTKLGGPLPDLAKPFTKSISPYPNAAAQSSYLSEQQGYIKLIRSNLGDWSGDRSYWSVSNGILSGESDGQHKLNRSLIWKSSTIRNFDLRMKVKLSSKGNSGIQYRAIDQPALGLDVVSGLQCEIVPTDQTGCGLLYDEMGRNIIAMAGHKIVIDANNQAWVVGQLPDFESKDTSGQWCDYRVIVRSNHQQHWIDGNLIIDVIDGSEMAPNEGLLAFQLQAGVATNVEFKNIEIKLLPDNLPSKQPLISGGAYQPHYYQSIPDYL